jgi:hypothetical protein
MNYYYQPPLPPPLPPSLSPHLTTRTNSHFYLFILVGFIIFTIITIIGFYLYQTQITPTPTPTPPSSETITSNNWLQLPGFDFPNNDISHTGWIHTPQECANICAKTPSCVGALYSPANLDCWAKSKILGIGNANNDRILLVPPLSPNNYVANWKMNVNQDIPGHDLACYNNIPAQNCAAACNAHTECLAYDKNQNGCCIKDASGPVTNSNNINVWHI